jgi:N,N'-diacetyllegionaminate synthase
MEKRHVLIIAEAGVNHNGDLGLAMEMARVAKECGADAVKYQTAVPELVISVFAPKAQYQKQTTGDKESQLEMVRKLHFDFEGHRKLKEYCDSIGILYLSSPFDIPSVEFLATLDLPCMKVPSGEITNYPYLVAVAKTGLPVILSTGMSVPEEIDAGMKVLREHGAGEITLLHCNTEYPTSYEDANLGAMLWLRDHFGCPVGLSDHTRGYECDVAAAALGATVIEKHFTLDKNMEGPDHKASLEPRELADMVRAVRNIEAAMGSGVKAVSPSEAKNKPIARKSIVAARAIRKGELLTEENLTTKRPGNGVSPMKWNEVLGTRAVRDFEYDELIEI